MTSPVFFVGSAAFAHLAQPALCAAEAPSSSASTQQHEPNSEQHTVPLSDTAEVSLQHSRRRLSTIMEENEEGAKRIASDESGERPSKRRVSLQKSGWTVAKGEPTSPPIDQKKQSNSVQVHISIPPTSPDLAASLRGEEVLGLPSWD